MKKANTNLLKKGISTVMTLALVSTLVLTGCGESEKQSSTDEGSGQNGNVKTIIIGSGTTYEPYCYLDDDGNAVGFEYDVLKEIDELLPQYEFQYEPMTFDNILLSLDSGKIDVAAHQLEATEERKAKYLFTNETYTQYISYIIVDINNNEINGIDDLQGRVVDGGGTTSAKNNILTKYNKEHTDNPIKIENNDSVGNELIVANLQSGKWDAEILPERQAKLINKEYGNGKEIVKTVGEPINTSNTSYLFKQGNETLRDDFDSALKKLKESGKLSELSQKWLDGDYTSKAGE